MDGRRVPGLSGFLGPPVSRVLRAVLRGRIPGAERRLLGHSGPRGQPNIPQLGPASAAADLLRPAHRLRRMKPLLENGQISIQSYLQETQERVLADDVLDGLTRPFKELPPKHFYDARGSELFEQICQLPEYYPTRSEREILERHATEIVSRTEAGELVELGSGSAEKARILLDAMAEEGHLRRYIPLDVSEQALQQAAEELVEEYEDLRVEGVVADF